MKRKINLEGLIEENIPEEVIRIIEKDGILEFFDYDKIRKMQNLEIDNYEVAELELLGKKYGVIMKKSLASALLDPQANDANILKEAGKKVNEALASAYKKTQLKPLETNLEKTIFKSYLSSLIMNLVEYPTDKPNEETLRQLGLYNPEISKLYANAAAAWLGSYVDVEKITAFSGTVSKLEKIGYTGKTEKVNLATESCRSESHYVLKTSINKQQIDVQIEIPKISDDYIKIEDEIVEYIMKNSNDPIVRENARNLVRLYLNMTILYDKNKPLPLEWNK